MANAILAAERWLYGVLTADDTLEGLIGTKVFSDVIPEYQNGATISAPYVYFTLASPGANLLSVGSHLVWSPLLYTVRYVDRTDDYTVLEEGATAVQDALHRASGSNISGTVLACIYEAPFKMTEIDRDGSIVLHLGGMYRLFVQ